MRIISGTYKNRRLLSPNSEDTHPMGERERNAIFNSLGSVEGLKVADFFAGTGALGIEALSRGAFSALFVEKSLKTLKILEKNLTSLAIPPANYSILKADATALSLSETFDLLFLDPPYSLASSLDFSVFLKYLSKNAKIVFSLPKTEQISLPPELNISHDAYYANCRIIIATLQ